MVNAPFSSVPEGPAPGPGPAAHAAALTGGGRNPPFDLAALAPLGARLAKGVRPVLEKMLHRDLRCWAEPPMVARFADYRGPQGAGLAAWLPLAMEGARLAPLLVLDGAAVLAMLDGFFGGPGDPPECVPDEFSPAAEAFVGQLGALVAPALAAAWKPIAPISFAAPGEATALARPILAPDEILVITPIGFAGPGLKSGRIDLAYPAVSLRPHEALLAGGPPSETAGPEPAWRTGLTRAVMAVDFPVRAVLAQPVVPLARLLALREGDVIPLDFGPLVPVFVGDRRLGTGEAGTANGRAAVRLTQFEPIDEEDFR